MYFITFRREHSLLQTVFLRVRKIQIWLKYLVCQECWVLWGFFVCLQSMYLIWDVCSSHFITDLKWQDLSSLNVCVIAFFFNCVFAFDENAAVSYGFTALWWWVLIFLKKKKMCLYVGDNTNCTRFKKKLLVQVIALDR